MAPLQVKQEYLNRIAWAKAQGFQRIAEIVQLKAEHWSPG